MVRITINLIIIIRKLINKLLIIRFYSFLPESPRWLITKKQYDKAYSFLFKAKSPHVLKQNILTEISLSGDMKKVFEIFVYIYVLILLFLFLLLF